MNIFERSIANKTGPGYRGSRSNFLPKALLISLIAHTALVSSGLLWHAPKPKDQASRRVEIEMKFQPHKQLDVSQRPIKPAQKLDLKSAAVGSGAIAVKLDGKMRTLPNNFLSDERRPEQIRSSQMVHHVSIVPIKSEKINNPAYASYNEMVRNRIEEKVYENYRRMDAGTVYLTFIIAVDGSLRGAQIIDEKTNASQNLREISLTSLKQSDFPPFLKGMTLPEYTFNIEIQYQVKD